MSEAITEQRRPAARRSTSPARASSRSLSAIGITLIVDRDHAQPDHLRDLGLIIVIVIDRDLWVGDTRRDIDELPEEHH